ncbi:MAG: GDSL-type esterase/lipase family protein [Stellaceae bacterium]
MSFVRHAAIVAALALAVAFPGAAPAQAQTLACRPFAANSLLAAPEPRRIAAARKRFDAITVAVRTRPYRALFFGDSLTRLWDPQNWQENLAPRGVLNAGVSGDRTEHLLWRLDHGNLSGPPPRVAIVLIGTNDLGHGRPPKIAAEGIRAVLVKLRARLPKTRILLLGLWPRGASVNDHLRQAVSAVNRMIETCGDNRAVYYADIGGVVLDFRGELTRAISPDLLHFSAAGYQRLSQPLVRLLDPLLAMPPP